MIVINKSNLNDVLSQIGAEPVVVKFDQQLSNDEVISLLSTLCDKEEDYYNDTKTVADIKYDFKGSDTELLTAVMKFAMQRETLINSSLIININILINGYNTLDDSLFESESVYVCDLEQLLDVKLDLVDEIKTLQTQITKWYLSCLKSAHKIEYTYLDDIVELPMLYNRILSSSNVLTLSHIMSKSGNIQTDELVLVNNAYSVVAEVVSCSNLANQLLKTIQTSMSNQ